MRIEEVMKGGGVVVVGAVKWLVCEVMAASTSGHQCKQREGKSNRHETLHHSNGS